MSLLRHHPVIVNRYIKWLSWSWIEELSKRVSTRDSMYGLVGAILSIFVKDKKSKILKTLMTYFYGIVLQSPTRYHSQVRRWQRKP